MKDLTSEQMAIVSAEMKKLSEAREGVKKPREIREWNDKINDAEALYGATEHITGLQEKLLVAWAMIWYCIFSTFQYLQAINREG